MEEWKIYKIGDLFSHFKSGKGIKADEITPKGDYPVFGGNGLRGYTSRYNFEGDCAIIGRQGAFCGNVRYFKGKAYMTEHAIIAVANDNNNTRFLAYLLGVMKLGRFSGQSAQPGLAVSELAKQLISVPALSLQNKIASILSSLDDKIELNRRLNDNLEQQAQAYFQELFIDNVAPELVLGTISDLGTVVGGSTPSKAKPEYYTTKGIAWITPKDLSNNKVKFISHGEHDITEFGLKNSSASIMPKGTVLFSSRAPIGYIAISSGEVTTNQGFKSVVPKSEIGTAFVYYSLKHNLPIIEGMASGSIFKEISGNTMKNVPVFIPDTETLAQFNHFCDFIFSQQQILEEQNQSLANLRDSLLPKLMSGELDVSELNI